MSIIRFNPSDIELFAAASHDQNPLHVSLLYARRTAVGEPVVFGILSALAALSEIPNQPGQVLGSVALTFRNPLFANVDYELSIAERKSGQFKISIKDAGRIMLTGQLGYRHEAVVEQAVWCVAADPQTKALSRPMVEFKPGLTVMGEYGPSAGPLQELIERWHLSDKGVSRERLSILLWCSYVVGMHLPGEPAVFSQLRLEFEPASTFDHLPLSYVANVTSFDERFDLLQVEAALARGSVPSARGELSAFVRRDSPRVSVHELAEKIPRSMALSGKTALVIGGSRGLGAALVAALASQGCHVFLNYLNSTDEAFALQERLHECSGGVTLFQGDATDVKWCRQLRTQLMNQGTDLDFLVCNASPPIGNLGFGLDSVARIIAFVDKSLSLACVPLAGFFDLLESRGGQVVLISSAVAAEGAHDYPPDWFHYVSAKYALEGLVRAIASQSSQLKFLIVRPPRLLTDQTNTTHGRQGAIPVEGVAAAIVKRLCDPGTNAKLETFELSDP